MTPESRTSHQSKPRRRRRRVLETKLPASDFHAPANWNAWESRARAQLSRAAGRAAR